MKKVHSDKELSIVQRRTKAFSKRKSSQELILPNIKVPNAVPDQHGTYRQIPDEHRGKEVISVIRNPYSKFISGYEFKHWARFPMLEDEVLKEHFLGFPDLSMDEFVDYNVPASKTRTGRSTDIGNQTIQSIQMFSAVDPSTVIDRISFEYTDDLSFKADLGTVTFLKQEGLNQDLADLLRRMQYSESDVTYVSNHQKVNVTKGKKTDLKLSDKAHSYVSHNERYLFKILSKLGIDYSYTL